MKRLLPLLSLSAVHAWGQCVMCFRTAAAQNLARARVLNLGILLLGAPPFLILGGLLVLLYRRSQVYAGGEPPPFSVERSALEADPQADRDS